MTIDEHNAQPISLWNWVLYIFVSGIPLIGFIMLLVWAFGEGNLHRKTWAKAMLLLFVIGIFFVFFLFFVVGIGGALVGLTNDLQKFE